MKPAGKFRKNTVARAEKTSGTGFGFPSRKVFLIGLPLLLFLVLVTGAYVFLRSAFQLREIVFSGNQHLNDDDLRALTGLSGKENLGTLSSSGVFRSMSTSPWIRSVSVRKEYPDSLNINIREAEPFALLDMNGRRFIVDSKGKLLEELKDNSVPFLPVISGSPFDKKEAYGEAINLVKAIKDAGLLSRRDRIEIIANRPQDMTVNFDGVVVKIGTGEYQDKLVRLLELEDEIKSRRIPVDYIDLRFANRVVVKPIAGVVQR